ncbi:MAG: divergent PAP2 family protein [Candidatus Omnitrophica bacterium]|nr:divergent PAP2 family protein [Candidatus Omnitrophota bacterium]
MNPLVEFSKNYIFLTSFAAWAIAQTIKVVLGIFREKRFNFRWFVGTGGMPSAHAASVAALSTSVGITYGFDSALFAIALTFTIIIMFDAQTTRLSSGKQAEILNKMLDDIYWKHKLDEEKLKEFLGHTPIQVFVGAGLGIVVSLLLYK